MSDPTAERRKALVWERQALSEEDVRAKSRLVIDHLVRFCSTRWTKESWAEGFLGLYRVGEGNPLREVDASTVHEKEYFSAANFAYPRVRSLADGTMDFVATAHPSDWKLGNFGLWEPRAELLPIAPETLTLVLCPGVAFDENGGRVGMGRGFYDRFLARARGTYRIGLAYDFQLVREPLVLQPHDQRMDAIVTESRVLTFT